MNKINTIALSMLLLLIAGTSHALTFKEKYAPQSVEVEISMHEDSQVPFFRFSYVDPELNETTPIANGEWISVQDVKRAQDSLNRSGRNTAILDVFGLAITGIGTGLVGGFIVSKVLWTMGITVDGVGSGLLMGVIGSGGIVGATWMMIKKMNPYSSWRPAELGNYLFDREKKQVIVEDLQLFQDDLTVLAETALSIKRSATKEKGSK